MNLTLLGAADRPLADAAPAEAPALSVPAELFRLLYSQVRALVGPRSDLDDLVQAAAERALRAYPRFEGRSAFSTWTYGIAYRTVLDQNRWFRRYSRRFTYSEDCAAPEPRAVHDSEHLTLARARALRLYVALDRLPAAKRAVVVLHDLEGLPLKEVAEVAGTNERTVRSRLRDARNKLAALLAEDPFFDAELAEEDT